MTFSRLMWYASMLIDYLFRYWLIFNLKWTNYYSMTEVKFVNLRPKKSFTNWPIMLVYFWYFHSLWSYLLRKIEKFFAIFKLQKKMNFKLWDKGSCDLCRPAFEMILNNAISCFVYIRINIYVKKNKRLNQTIHPRL